LVIWVSKFVFNMKKGREVQAAKNRHATSRRTLLPKKKAMIKCRLVREFGM